MLNFFHGRHIFFQATPHDFVTTGDGTLPLDRTALLSTEFYAPENAPLFEYFDDFDDLAQRLQRLDVTARRREILVWAQAHKNTTLRRWQAIDEHLAR
eukprot:7323148-Prymnesium_polylepis.1